MADGLMMKAAFDLCKALHKVGPQVMGREIASTVEKHSIGAAAASIGIAWLPAAGATAALVANAGFVWSMYFRINSKIGLPFSKHVLKSLATAIGTNIAAYATGSVIGATVLSLPVFMGLGNVASSAIMSALAFAITWSCGLVYLKVLTRFAEANVNFDDVSEEDIKAMAKDVLAKEDIKAMMRQASSQYKEAKARGDINKDGDNVKPMEDEA